jgi:hypothetical protein
MKPRGLIRMIGAGLTVGLLVAASTSMSGQMLPSTPKKAFGASVSPAFEGWYDNADGSHTFLIGYYNRNWTSEVDVPIGASNHFEPGDPDRGQPTHFMANRGWGVFTITVPKSTPATEKLWWVLNVNGVAQRVSFYMSPDYNITPQQASEESPGGKYNRPPVLRLTEGGAAIQNPVATMVSASERTATVGVPMPLQLWVEDDALYSSGSNAPISETSKIVEILVQKYRGPGSITVAKGLDKLSITKGGKPAEPFAANGATTVTFSEPGNYALLVTVNDLSGPGGGATGCCWTTSLIKVGVRGATTEMP